MLQRLKRIVENNQDPLVENEGQIRLRHPECFRDSHQVDELVCTVAELVEALLFFLLSE